MPGNTPTVYTYTITIENVGTVPLHVSRIKDLLPKGFLYTGGSTAGTITSGDPADKLDTQTERQRLDWDLTPKLEIQTGETRTLVFKAQAAVSPQDYWNDVWVTFDKGEFAEPVYTWPTALVKVMSVFETTASDGQSLVYSEVWIGTDSHVVKRWVVER